MMPDGQRSLTVVGMPQTKGHSGIISQSSQSFALRYGLAVGSVAIALVLGLLLKRYNFNAVELPLFLFAVGITAWQGGMGPAVLSITLACISFDFFFVVPIYSLAFTVADVPRLVILICFGALITRFNTVRRRVEEELRQARDKLQDEVVERSQQASLLNLT